MPKLLLLSAAALLAIASGAAAQTTPRTTVAQGVLSGTSDRGAAAFLGVPFAAPPVGAGRWAPPKPAASWAGVKAAAAYGPACPQTLAPAGGRAQWTDEFMHPAQLGVSEDCLTLNVWTPAELASGKPSRTGLPVLVYIYGGAFQEGSNAVAVYNGANMAKKGLVVVGVNYRVGPLGFLAHPELSAEQGGASGDYGIQDQIAALQWVRENIAAFGGDPAKVTIAGQSAGAMSVHSLIASPLARGLFRGAISESGGVGGTFAAAGPALESGRAYLTRLGVGSITEARALPLEKLMATPAPRFGVIADGKVIPAGPSPTPAASDVPVLIGANLNEGAPKVVTAAAWRTDLQARYGGQAANALRLYPASTDAQASASADRENADRTFLTYRQFVDRRASPRPVYAYQFTHVLPGPKSAQYGVFHTSEVPYAYDTLEQTVGRSLSDADRKVAAQMSAYWANFVKTGDPNGAGLPRWPAFSQTGQVMNLGDAPAARTPDLALLGAAQPPSTAAAAASPSAGANAGR